MDPLDSQHIVAASMQFPPGTIPDAPRATLNPIRSYIHVSFDGGATWETQRVEGGPGSAPTDEHGMESKMGDVVVAFLPDGAPLVSYLANTRVALPIPVADEVQDDNSVYVSRSSDGGRTWPQTVVVAARGGGLHAGGIGTTGDVQSYVYHDREWMVTGADGGILMAWTAYTPDGTRIMFAASHDGGLTWSPYRALDEAPGEYNGLAFPLIQRDGTWHIAYHRPSTGRLMLASSSDEGASWDSREVGEPSHDSSSLGSLGGTPNLRAGVHGSGERLWLSYAIPGDSEETEIPTVRWSDDGGSTWTAPLALDGQLPVGTSLLTLDVATDGTAYAAWFHDHDTTTDLRVAAFQGDHMIPPLTVQGDLAGSGNNVGHYFGLAALPGGAMVAYTVEGAAGRGVVAARLTLGGGS
ncbi:MAG TPA: exo-alpha-sialidase [Candidatus Thermoplasmatota archaeon]|nr:exo-alpha-sialidase [Candidatus Thermoplasmatota archaeon]